MTKSMKSSRVVRAETLEREINTEAFEAFYHIGQKLLQMKRERLYEDLGFKSWSAYCASGRIDYKRAQADWYIRSAELRPRIEAATKTSSHEWSVSQMVELCKCETDNDAKRVAKKSIALAKKKGERLTAKLIAKVRDGDDETGAESKKQKRALEAASLDRHLDRLADILLDWRMSLEGVDVSAWEEVTSEVLTRVKHEAHALYSFLRS